MRCSGPPRATPLLESLVGYSRAVRVGQWVSVAGTAAAERAAQRATRDDQVLLVAVVDGRVLGLAEVSLDPPPPAHQILLPVPSAHLHAVVAARARGQGLGRRLELAAREWAGSRGAQQLIAGIQVDNQAAIDFYDRCGYRANATIRLRD